jgi:hypothetical protein
MRRSVLVVATLALGFALGNLVPGALGAPRVGDAKFENLFVKTVSPTAERPASVRVQGGADYSVISIDRVEDDFIVVTLKSKEVAYLRIRDIVAVSAAAAGG